MLAATTAASPDSFASPTEATSTTINPAIPVFTFAGFFAPVDNPPTINSMNAGRAVPVKFSLGGDQGLNIFNPGYPTSQQVNCTTGDPSPRSSRPSPPEAAVSNSTRHRPVRCSRLGLSRLFGACAGACPRVKRSLPISVHGQLAGSAGLRACRCERGSVSRAAMPRASSRLSSSRSRRSLLIQVW